MKSFVQRAINLGFEAWLELLFYPIFILWRMPIAWLGSLWGSRLLLHGRWSDFMGFNPANSINSLYYRTHWVNLDRYGQNGVSPVVGLGDYPLSRWFHVSLLSSYFYANAGAVTMLLGTLIWVFSHMLWLETADPVWTLLVTALLFLSTTSYAMAFRRQNYQVLAWMWMPVALFAMHQELWVLAAFAWFAASMAGITAIFFAVPLMFVEAGVTQSFTPVFILLPAVIKVCFNVISSFNFSGWGGLKEFAKLIGVTKKDVVYKRTSMRFDADNVYFIILYASGCGLLWWFYNDVPVLPLAALALYIMNQRFLRVADDQSVVMVFVTVTVFYVLAAPANYWGLLVLWFVINPMPSFIKITDGLKRAHNKPAVNAPFDHSPLEMGVAELLAKVPKNASVLFAYADPGGVYEKVFDGYRIINELVYYVGSKTQRHIFPDWYAVAESNYEGAKNLWGRTEEEVVSNLQTWNTSFALVYQESGLALSESWQTEFDVLASFDWADYQENLNSAKLWGGNPTPCWYLLKKK